MGQITFELQKTAPQAQTAAALVKTGFVQTRFQTTLAGIGRDQAQVEQAADVNGKYRT